MRNYLLSELDDVERMLGVSLPHEIRAYLQDIAVVGAVTMIEEEEDESGMGAEFRWMEPLQMVSEGRDCFPGVAISRHGFLPIGICQEGSGDPYFVRLCDGALVRVLHDAPWSDGLQEEAVELVSRSLPDAAATGQ